MGSSRREFMHRSVLGVGGFALYQMGCGWAHQEEATVDASVQPEPAISKPGYVALAESGELKHRDEALWEILRSCRCCPRECGADRLAGEKGVCSSTSRLKLHSHGPHFGEETPLVGLRGSGTVFFSHCNLLCCYCQNWEINHRGDGRYVDHRELADAMLDLQKRGCHNINFVTPTHVVPNIVRALRLAVPRGLKLPLVYNSGGYDNLEMVKLLDGIVDIYLPDFKYQDGELAARYSSEASDYPRMASQVILEMFRQVGHLQVDSLGIAQKGLIIRHLVLPHNIAGTDLFVEWVAREIGPETYVNIMAQYRPEHRAAEYPEINRRLTGEEWRQALTWAREAGLENQAAS